MTDLYRINEEHDLTRAPADVLIMLGVLVPVHRCEHGNVFLHTVEDSIRAALLIDNPEDALWRCGGSPDLDAFTEEEQ